MKWLEPALSVLTITALTGSGALPTATPTPTPTAPTGQGTASSTNKPMQLGINLPAPSYFGQERMFMNLLSGGSRQLIGTDGKYAYMPDDRLDANYDVVKLDPKEIVVRALNVPTKALRGTTVDIKCSWKGTATKVWFGGNPPKNVKVAKNSATFSWVPKGYENATLYYQGVSADDPVRSIDCREADADPDAVFDATFIDNVKRYSTIRFMNWSLATNGNGAVTWAQRNKPGSGHFNIHDGVALEYMIQLANQTKSNPWFTVPWNADAAYVRGMAELIRDKLDSGLVAYVEVSNETWNYQFKVATQASQEGLAEGLSTDQYEANYFRHGEKTGQVMDVWTDVFKGQMSRIVRVLASQQGTWALGRSLRFKDTAQKVDALATAPYFGGSIAATVTDTAAKRDVFFATTLPAKQDEVFVLAKQSKALAAQYNLRYIAYEGGQHVLLSTDLDTYKLLQRDTRMGKLYTKFLTRWQQEVGDLLTLYTDVGPISSYGAWGQQEYAGQPLADAPKAAAVDLFRKSYLSRN